jgi:hypothetical protein
MMVDWWTDLTVFDIGAIAGITIAVCATPRRHGRRPEHPTELDQADEERERYAAPNAGEHGAPGPAPSTAFLTCSADPGSIDRVRYAVGRARGTSRT